MIIFVKGLNILFLRFIIIALTKLHNKTVIKYVQLSHKLGFKATSPYYVWQCDIFPGTTGAPSGSSFLEIYCSKITVLIFKIRKAWNVTERE